VTPFRVNPVGAAALPLCVAWKPIVVEPPGEDGSALDGRGLEGGALDGRGLDGCGLGGEGPPPPPPPPPSMDGAQRAVATDRAARRTRQAAP